jgi:2-iminoacetate synthase
MNIFNEIKNLNIIDEQKIHTTIDKAGKSDSGRIDEILEKALELNGLDFDDIAGLLSIEDDALLEKLFHTAFKIKEEIYGSRLVLFAPLYISNFCSNNCLYCGFRSDNKEIDRSALSIEDIKEETLSILRQGHKRVLMLMGEHHSKSPLEYFLEAIDAVYSVKDEKGSNIRRINLEIAPLTNDEFRHLAKVPIGTYTVFQETYHRETYKVMHPSGVKSNYDWRLEVMDRALSNGMHDVGIGTLFGLYDYKFEVLAMIQHAKHLDKEFNIGPHTISIPRIRPAMNAPVSQQIPHAVSDRDFKKLVAVLRCAVPYTGMILSTREPADLRMELFNIGVSQISAGSRTNPGGYKQRLNEEEHDGQFNLNDCRSSGEIIQDVIKLGFIPSFCTSCYRSGRVGEDFMDQAKPGLIKLFCQPNALTTLKEYLLDYADDETRAMGEKLIMGELERIPNDSVRETTSGFLHKIEMGERDLFL